MTFKQNAIKEFKDAKYMETVYRLKVQHLTDPKKVDDCFKRLLEKQAIVEALERCFSDNDKKHLLPKLVAQCESVAKTHFVIYGMGKEC